MKSVKESSGDSYLAICTAISKVNIHYKLYMCILCLEQGYYVLVPTQIVHCIIQYSGIILYFFALIQNLKPGQNCIFCLKNSCSTVHCVVLSILIHTCLYCSTIHVGFSLCLTFHPICPESTSRSNHRLTQLPEPRLSNRGTIELH